MVRPQEAPRQPSEVFQVQPTPIRSNMRAPLGPNTPQASGPVITVSSPTPLVFRQVPSWALDSDDRSILNPSFVPNPNLQLDFSSIPQGTTPGDRFMATNSLGCQSRVAHRQQTPANHAPAVPASSLALGAHANSVSRAPSPSLSATRFAASASPALPFNHLFATDPNNAQRRSISPGLFQVHSSGNTTVHASCPSSRGPTPQPPALTTLHSAISQSLLTEPVPLPLNSTTTIPNQAVAPATQNPAPSTSMKNLRGTFTYEQNEFITWMKYRWEWFLLTEDAFPVNLAHAQESTIAYAEKQLNTTRTAAGITKRVFDYVSNSSAPILLTNRIARSVGRSHAFEVVSAGCSSTS